MSCDTANKLALSSPVWSPSAENTHEDAVVRCSSTIDHHSQQPRIRSTKSVKITRADPRQTGVPNSVETPISNRGRFPSSKTSPSSLNKTTTRSARAPPPSIAAGFPGTPSTYYGEMSRNSYRPVTTRNASVLVKSPFKQIPASASARPVRAHLYESTSRQHVSQNEPMAEDRLARSASPGTAIKTQTMTQIENAQRVMSLLQDAPINRYYGRLLKARLKPLQVCHTDGPSIYECLGVQPDRRTYSPSPSRQYQDQAGPQTRPGFQEHRSSVHSKVTTTPTPLPRAESVHRTSFSSACGDEFPSHLDSEPRKDSTTSSVGVDQKANGRVSSGLSTSKQGSIDETTVVGNNNIDDTSFSAPFLTQESPRDSVSSIDSMSN